MNKENYRIIVEFSSDSEFAYKPEFFMDLIKKDPDDVYLNTLSKDFGNILLEWKFSCINQARSAYNNLNKFDNRNKDFYAYLTTKRNTDNYLGV